MTDDIVPFDLFRMFLGKDSPVLLLEILFRSVLIYGYAFALLRWIGARSVAQFSLIEFLLVIALGSAVGDAMFYPDVPLLHAMLVITVIVLLNKGLDMLVERRDSIKRVIDGEPVEVVRDGKLCMDGLKRRNMSTGELFEQLRINGVRSLSEVTHAYVEPSGVLSLFRDEERQDGVSLIPPDGISARQKDFVTAADTQLFQCQNCCKDVEAKFLRANGSCETCQKTTWLPVVREC